MTAPTLLAVAHGSQDPAARQTIGLLAGRIARLAPDLSVRVAFLQHAGPSLASALTAAGGDVVVVPLLLSSGYHLSAEVRRAARAAGAAVAVPLGPDPHLVTPLIDQLAAAGTPDGTPVVLAAAGSSDPLAAADVERQAQLLSGRLGAPVLAAYASASRPTVAQAVATLRARTEKPVAVASYLLAPGQFHDRLGLSTAAWVSATLGGHPAVAALALHRFRAACPAT